MHDDVLTTARDASDRLVVRSHAGVVAVAQDPETFSNAVSRHLQIPNGLDGDEHAAARRLLDPFLAVDAVDALEPAFRRTADALVADLVDRGGAFDAVADLGARYAVRAQSGWLGWEPALEEQLLAWVAAHRAASRSGDRVETGRVAQEFDDIVTTLLAERRAEPRDDVTTRLTTLRTADGRLLGDAEIVSVLRNWTGGDLSSMALCAGVVVHWLASHADHQHHLAGADDAALDAALDEILRADDPFVSNRRVARRATVVDGCPVAPGDVVVVDWRAANRDPERFADPAGFDPQGNADGNLVYGTGPHVCPGRALATRQLRVLVRALLGAGTVVLDPASAPERETAPVAGFRTVPVRVVPRV